MNPIHIIKEALEDGVALRGNQDTFANALTALDSLTVKVSDEEIERMALAEYPKEVTDGDEAFTSMLRGHYVKALRHARDNWLASSPWISVEMACYYTLKEALLIAMRDASEHEDPSLYVMQLRAIIDRLRTRLGINTE